MKAVVPKSHFDPRCSQFAKTCAKSAQNAMNCHWDFFGNPVVTIEQNICCFTDQAKPILSQHIKETGNSITPKFDTIALLAFSMDAHLYTKKLTGFYKSISMSNTLNSLCQICTSIELRL